MPLDVWAVYTATLVAVVLAPGPAVLLVVSHGLSGDARAGLLAALGIAGSSAVYFVLAALGLTAVLDASAAAFEAVRWAGVAYLVWVGTRTIVTARRPPDRQGRGEAPRTGWRPFADALALQSGSPNAVAFFTAILPQFVDPARSAAPQFLVLGATSVVVEVAVLALYLAVARRTRRRFDTPSAVAWQRRIGGGMLLASALGLALAGRR